MDLPQAPGNMCFFVESTPLGVGSKEAEDKNPSSFVLFGVEQPKFICPFWGLVY